MSDSPITSAELAREALALLPGCVWCIAKDPQRRATHYVPVTGPHLCDEHAQGWTGPQRSPELRPVPWRAALALLERACGEEVKP
jgi:hypothetical protein